MKANPLKGVQSLPHEILEKVIENASAKYAFRVYDLRQYALVCRQWALIANNLIWGVLDLRSLRNTKEFRVYNHLKTPGVRCGKYVQKLILDEAKLWPICIKKILQACPNIKELTIKRYEYKGSKGNVRDLLKDIQILLPNLQKLNLDGSHEYFEGIERLIENRKDLQIKATRKCKSSEYPDVFERYSKKEWEECRFCLHKRRGC